MRDGESRYELDSDYSIGRPLLDSSQLRQVITALDTAQVGQVTQVQVTADQNNYPLVEAELVRLSTDASRTFTGFTPPRRGRFILLNVGAQDVVLAHQSASSTAENRIITPNAASYTLNANESAEIIYDFTTSRWRILSGTGA